MYRYKFLGCVQCVLEARKTTNSPRGSLGVDYFSANEPRKFLKRKFEFPAASELAATTSQRCAKWSS